MPRAWRSGLGDLNMYVRVSDELKRQVLERLRHDLFWSSILYFPILVLIFGGMATLFIFVHGHLFLKKLADNSSLSETQIIIGSILASCLLAAIGLIFILRKQYKALAYEDHFYCLDCDAVDNEDEGWCPFCKASLQNKATFIMIFGKDQQKILKNVGLEASKEAWLAPGTPSANKL